MAARTTNWNRAACVGLAPPQEGPDEGARKRHQTGCAGLIQRRDEGFTGGGMSDVPNCLTR